MFFNRGHYEVCEFVQRLYRDVFPNLFLVGPPPTTPALAELARKCNVIVSASYGSSDARRAGFVLQEQFAQFMLDFPGFDGYLLAHEDVVVNAPQWLRWDAFPRTSATGPVMFRIDATRRPEKRDWPTWRSPFGYPAALRLNGSAEFQAKYASAFHSQCANAWPMGWSDVVFVAGDVATVAADFLLLSAKHDLFMELALPAFFRCVLPGLFGSPASRVRSLAAVVNFYWHVGTFDEVTLDKYWDVVANEHRNHANAAHPQLDAVDVVHPTKFSHADVRAWAVRKMDALLRQACGPL